MTFRPIVKIPPKSRFVRKCEILLDLRTVPYVYKDLSRGYTVGFPLAEDLVSSFFIGHQTRTGSGQRLKNTAYLDR